MGPTRREISTLVRLAVPVVGTQVGAMLMGVVDTIMLGSVGPSALAAAGLGAACIWGTLVIADGLVRGIDPIVAQAHGARDGARAALALQRGLVIAVGISFPIGGLWLFTEDFLLATGQNAELAALAQRYVLVQIPSIVCHTVYMALRGYLQGRAIMNPALWVMVLREPRPHLRQLGADLRSPGRARSRRRRRRHRDEPDAHARARRARLADARAAPARGSLAAVEPRGALARRIAPGARARACRSGSRWASRSGPSRSRR